MDLSKVEKELIIEGLNILKGGYENRGASNVCVRIASLITRLKKDD